MRPHSTPRRILVHGSRPPSGRRLALASVVIHLAGILGGYLHFALVRHVRCPEHGELVHASAEANLIGGESAPARARPTDQPAVTRGSRPAGDAHDPCSSMAALRLRAPRSSAISLERSDSPVVGAMLSDTPW